MSDEYERASTLDRHIDIALWDFTGALWVGDDTAAEYNRGRIAQMLKELAVLGESADAKVADFTAARLRYWPDRLAQEIARERARH